MRKSHHEFARQTGASATRARNLIRRYVVKATDAVSWLLEGFRDEAGNVDSERAEVFSGIGIAARPPANGAPEAVVVNIGGQANHSVIVATRDYQTEKAVVSVATLEPGDTLVFNQIRILRLTAAGDVLIGDLGGNFQPVALAEHRHDLPPMQAGPYPVVAADVEPPPDLPPGTPWPPGSPGATGPSSANSEHVKVT